MAVGWQWEAVGDSEGGSGVAVRGSGMAAGDNEMAVEWQ